MNAERPKAKPEGAEEAESSGLPRAQWSAENAVTDQVIGAAIEVHKQLGPGLMESAYEECLCYELSQRGVKFERQVHLPIAYKGLKLDCGYRMDLVVENLVVVEIKAIDELLPIHSAQVLTYLRSSGKRIGLLLNFNVTVLKQGLRRLANRYVDPAEAPRVSASSAPAVGEEQSTRTSPNSLRPPLRLCASAVKKEAH
jgi:GxxExxY protein